MKWRAYKAVEVIFMSVFSLLTLVISVWISEILVRGFNDNLTMAGYLIMTALMTGIGAKIGQKIAYVVLDHIEDYLTAKAIRDYEDND